MVRAWQSVIIGLIFISTNCYAIVTRLSTPPALQGEPVAEQNYLFEIYNNIVLKPSLTIDITAAGGITVTHKIMRVQGSGGAIDITANPQIVDGYDGQIVYLQGDSDTNTVKLDDATGLQLAGAASFTMGKGDIIVLTYDKGDDLWIEVSRSNN